MPIVIDPGTGPILYPDQSDAVLSFGPGGSGPLGFLPDNHVLLGKSVLPINGQVSITQATTTAPKITIGDTTRASNTLADEWTVSDNAAGLLIKYLDEQTNLGRFFWSTCATWTPRRLLLPPLVTNIDPPEGVTASIDGIWEFQSDLYVSFEGAIWRIDHETGAWDAEASYDMGVAATDACVYKGVLYVANSGGYSYFDGATWTDSTQAVKYFCVFDVHPSNKLMSVDGEGNVVASIDGFSWTTQIGGEVVDAIPTKLLSYRNPVDEPALFVASTAGLTACDPFTKTNAPTSLQVIKEDSNGKGTLVWTDGNLYYPNGLSLWRYPKTGQINNVGLDRDDGLPPFARGRITSLCSLPTYLVAGVDFTKIVEGSEDTLWVSDEDLYGAASFESSAESGSSYLFLYTGTGWHTLYQTQEQSTGIGATCFTAVFGRERRLFFGVGGALRYVVIPEGNYDPTLDPQARFAETAEHITGWFDSGYEEVKKIAVSFNIRAKGITETEQIAVEYGLNEQDGWFPLGKVTPSNTDASGHCRLPFVDKDLSPALGKTFYSIRFRFTLRRGSDPSKTPSIVFSNLVFKRQHNKLFAFTFQCSAQDIGELRSMWQTVLGYMTSNLLWPFIYRNQDVDEQYSVLVLSVSAMRPAGGSAGGTFTITCSELEN